jgi:hypothetical protein
VDNIKTDLREISLESEDLDSGFEGVGWIHLAQYRDWWWAPVNTAMNLQVP